MLARIAGPHFLSLLDFDSRQCDLDLSEAPVSETSPRPNASAALTIARAEARQTIGRGEVGVRATVKSTAE